MPKMRLTQGGLAFYSNGGLVRMRPGQVANVPSDVAKRYEHKLEPVANNTTSTASRKSKSEE